MLGDGVGYVFLVVGGIFIVFNDFDGMWLVIINDGGVGVMMVDCNMICGFVIDGMGVNLINGIFVDGLVNVVIDGIIEDVII